MVGRDSTLLSTNTYPCGRKGKRKRQGNGADNGSFVVEFCMHDSTDGQGSDTPYGVPLVALNLDLHCWICIGWRLCMAWSDFFLRSWDAYIR